MYPLSLNAPRRSRESKTLFPFETSGLVLELEAEKLEYDIEGCEAAGAGFSCVTPLRETTGSVERFTVPY